MLLGDDGIIQFRDTAGEFRSRYEPLRLFFSQTAYLRSVSTVIDYEVDRQQYRVRSLILQINRAASRGREVPPPIDADNFDVQPLAIDSNENVMIGV